jgi:hypothetical protein
MYRFKPMEVDLLPDVSKCFQALVTGRGFVAKAYSTLLPIYQYFRGESSRIEIFFSKIYFFYIIVEILSLKLSVNWEHGTQILYRQGFGCYQWSKMYGNTWEH